MCDIKHLIDTAHERAGITKLEAADRMGINYSTYKRKTNEHGDRDITVPELVSFIRAHDMDFTVLDRIEERLGRVAFCLPKAKDTVGIKDITEAIKQLLAASQRMVDIVEDNKIDADEAQDLGAITIQLNQMICELQGKLMNRFHKRLNRT